MMYSKHYKYLFVSIIFFLSLISCRKKDEKYEGNYIGIERYTYLDSGATSYTIDSTYNQEVDVTYDKLPHSSKKAYTILRVFNNPGNVIFQQQGKSIVDHEYSSAGGYLKFSGDSMYLNVSNLSDATDSWDHIEEWSFSGKRN